MKDEALKLALEALELEDMACRYEKEPTPEHIAKAITAIKQARSAPVQEPVAWRRYEGEEHMTKDTALRIALEAFNKLAIAFIHKLEP